MVTMFIKPIFVVLVLVFGDFSGQVYGADADCNNLDLNIRHTALTVTDTGLSMEWRLGIETECEIVYLFTATDEEYGVIRNDTMENPSIQMDISPCVRYNLDITAIYKANTTIQGPRSRSGIRLSDAVQQIPRLKSLNIHSTSIDGVWALQGERNRCPLKALYLVGDQVNITVPLEYLPSPVESVPVEVTNLTPNTLYFFQVSVENSGGISEIYRMSVRTLG